MNIFIGKFGKSIAFKRSSWGPIGGDNEAPIYYENLFHHNPTVQFYIFGASDYSRLPHEEQAHINKHGNVHDVWGDEFKKFKTSYTKDKLALRVDYLDQWTAAANDRGLKMDAGVLIAGPNATSNVPYRCTKMTDPNQLSTPIDMIGMYAGPIVSYLNEYKVPYLLIVNDPRFFPFMAKDIMHPPSMVLSQYNETIQYKHRVSYTDNAIKTLPIDCKYAAVETIYLINERKNKTDSFSLESFIKESADEAKEIKKDIAFMIVLNEGRPSRYNLLKENILNDINDVSIYGKWDPKVIGDDHRFKGSVKYEELQSMLPRVKYSYCIPIKKGWVTMKFWELIHHDVIPFLHPTYDEQNNLKAPEFLRVINSAELFKKIKFLEENPSAYDTLLKNLKSMITEEHRNGEFLNDITMDAVNEITSN